MTLFTSVSPLRVVSRLLWKRPRSHILALPLALILGSCLNTAPSGPKDSAVSDVLPIPHDVQLAIWEIESNCPEVGAALLGMLENGDIYYTDVQGQYGDIAWAFFDGPILLDQEYYGGLSSTARHSALVADLMHEAGHAIGHLYDHPGCCPHYNDYDYGCPG